MEVNPRLSRRKFILRYLFVVYFFVACCIFWCQININNYRRHDISHSYLRQNTPGFSKIKEINTSKGMLNKKAITWNTGYDNKDNLRIQYVDKPMSRNTFANHHRKLYKKDFIMTDFEYFYNESTKDKLQDSLLHKHHFRMLLNNEEMCKEQDIFLVIFIHSATYKTERRHYIRSTFCSISEFKGKSIKCVFVIGQTNNHDVQTELFKEASTFNDIVQSNFTDSYRNLTYKQVLGLYWVHKFCNQSKFVIKIDDDVVVNMPLVVDHLENKTKNNMTTNMFECRYYLRDGPERNPHSKWYLTSDEYPFSRFPPYCTGYSIIMTADVVRKLLTATKFVPFFWIDDVYVDGFLPWVANITMYTPSNFVSDVDKTCLNITPSLFYSVPFKNYFLFKNLWSKVLNYT